MENQVLSYKDFLANQSVQVDMVAFLINLVLVTLFSLVLAYLYRRFGRSLSNRTEFSKNFVMLSITTMVIISIVKASLALSLGLVGALSIVRFRSAIKEPEELTYLFFCIALGLGMGADQRLTTVAAMGFISTVIVIKGLILNEKRSSNFYMNVSIPEEADGLAEKVSDILKKFSSKLVLRRFNTSSDRLDMTFAVEFSKFADLTSAVSSIKEISNNCEVSYIENVGDL